MELLIEVTFGFAALTGAVFIKAILCLFKAIAEFNRLFKQYQ